MSNVLLISETLLKQQTGINENVDSGALKSSILLSQNINLQESLSTALYDKVLDLVYTNEITGSTNSNYKNLLDNYIVPMVTHYSYFYALDNFIFKFMNVGLVQGFSEQGSSVDINLFKMMKNSAKDKAEWYDNRLREYLFNNDNLFPEYQTSTTDGSLPASTTDGVTAQIVFDKPMFTKDYDPTCCMGRYRRF